MTTWLGAFPAATPLSSSIAPNGGSRALTGLKSRLIYKSPWHSCTLGGATCLLFIWISKYLARQLLSTLPIWAVICAKRFTSDSWGMQSTKSTSKKELRPFSVKSLCKNGWSSWSTVFPEPVCSVSSGGLLKWSLFLRALSVWLIWPLKSSLSTLLAWSTWSHLASSIRLRS